MNPGNGSFSQEGGWKALGSVNLGFRHMEEMIRWIKYDGEEPRDTIGALKVPGGYEENDASRANG